MDKLAVKRQLRGPSLMDGQVGSCQGSDKKYNGEAYGSVFGMASEVLKT